METIGEASFKSCQRLQKITIPSKVEEIPASAFEFSDLSLGIVLKNVKTIGDRAFYRCSFSEITIPSSVTSIGSEAFYTFTLDQTEEEHGDLYWEKGGGRVYVGRALVKKTYYYTTNLSRIIVNRSKGSIIGSWGVYCGESEWSTTKTLWDNNHMYSVEYTYTEKTVYGSKGKPEVVWAGT